MTGTSARGERRVKLVHVFERDAAALHDAVERFFGDVNGQARLFLQKLIEVAQERAAPVSMRPCSAMSAPSSGGVFSSAFLTATTI